MHLNKFDQQVDLHWWCSSTIGSLSPKTAKSIEKGARGTGQTIDSDSMIILNCELHTDGEQHLNGTCFWSQSVPLTTITRILNVAGFLYLKLVSLVKLVPSQVTPMKTQQDRPNLWLVRIEMSIVASSSKHPCFGRSQPGCCC